MRDAIRSRALALALLMLLPPLGVGAQDGTTTAPAPATESQAMARELLVGMARYIAAQGRFRVDMQVEYDSVQPDGRKIEFGDRRTITVRRPDRLRVEIVQSDGDEATIYYDGSTVTMFNATANAYAQEPAAQTLDAAVAHFIKELEMRLPLAALLINRVAEEIDRRVSEVEYVELSNRCVMPCHHLAARTATTDVQVWIASGQAPVPLRVSVTYRDAPGEPQFRADLSNWNFAPATEDALFVFTPPQGAAKIPFAVKVKPPAEGEAAQAKEGQP